MENAALDLGTEFEFDLLTLSNNFDTFTVQQLITALEATTTLTKLTVYNDRDVYQPHFPRLRVVEAICRCLANLRLQNEHHPLQTVEFEDVDAIAVRQFLVALKQFGIRRFVFWSDEPFPIHYLMDFCRDNSNLKVLELQEMQFTGEVATDPIGGSATNLNLDKLILENITFKTSFAATNFAHLLSHMSVSALELRALSPRVDIATGGNVEYDEDSVTKRIVSGFKMPSVEQLTLNFKCKVKHFQAALDAGMTTVKRLTVEFVQRNKPSATTERLEAERLEALTRMIRGAVKLNSLTIKTYGSYHPRLPRQLVQALEACASVTEIHVNNDGERQDFTEHEEQQLRQVTARNSELGQFVSNPSTFPIAKLLNLMRQFDKCPTGLYVLTRRLPEMFSFEKGNCLFPLTRKLRKRRKISDYFKK